MSKLDFIDDELKKLELVHRRRHLKRLEMAGSRYVQYDGKALVNFSSNDYLGLSLHPLVKQAAQEATERYHASAASSRLICGNLEIHEQLEEELACFKGKEAALVFSTGYMTNLGILTALAGEEDQIFSDMLNHASIIDGCRLSRSRTFIYRHKDSSHLESLLRSAPQCRRRLIVSDAIFSMDGDVADLPELAELAERYDCLLILDEAHATGILGSHGHGIVEHFMEQGRIHPEAKDCVDLAMGTLSKALGSFGGFVACSAKMRELLLNKARSFIFATALLPAAVGAARASLQLIQTEPSHRDALWKNCALLNRKLRASGFDLACTESPILPVSFGEEAAAVQFSERLLTKGFYVPAIRPPSVPMGSSRLRITVTARHSEMEIDNLVGEMGELARSEQTGRKMPASK